MTEEPKEKQSEEFQFINEKIVPKKKKKGLKRLGTVLFVICMAVLFGLVSQVVFLTSGEMVSNLLGLEERQQVDLPRPTEPQPTNTAKVTLTPTATLKSSPVPTEQAVTPVPTDAAKATKAPTETEIPEETEIPQETKAPSVTAPSDMTPVPTPEETVVPEPSISVTVVPTEGIQQPTAAPTDTEKNPEESQKDNIGLAYIQMYREIVQVADEVSAALVTVEAVEQGIDWFKEVYEIRTKTTGLIMANDGIDLLILVGTDQISGANAIEVYLGEKVIAGRIYSLDKDYGLAVIAVPLSLIPEETYNQLSLGLLAEEDEIAVGTPVIALGAPNGYEGSMEIGMVTSLGSAVSVTDGEMAYFTTNITDYSNGYGYVISMDGKVLGMITHTHKENPQDGIFTAVSLDSISGVIQKLLNNQERAYFGIKGQDLPKKLQVENELTEGVYVSEVENASPALTAGIKTGDIIVSVGNVPVSGIRQFSEVILERSTREIVQVKLMRKAEDGMRTMTVEVALTGKK